MYRGYKGNRGDKGRDSGVNEDNGENRNNEDNEDVVNVTNIFTSTASNKKNLIGDEYNLFASKYAKIQKYYKSLKNENDLRRLFNLIIVFGNFLRTEYFQSEHQTLKRELIDCLDILMDTHKFAIINQLNFFSSDKNTRAKRENLIGYYDGMKEQYIYLYENIPRFTNNMKKNQNMFNEINTRLSKFRDNKSKKAVKAVTIPSPITSIFPSSSSSETSDLLTKRRRNYNNNITGKKTKNMTKSRKVRK